MIYIKIKDKRERTSRWYYIDLSNGRSRSGRTINSVNTTLRSPELEERGIERKANTSPRSPVAGSMYANLRRGIYFWFASRPSLPTCLLSVSTFAFFAGCPSERDTEEESVVELMLSEEALFPLLLYKGVSSPFKGVCGKVMLTNLSSK